MGKTTEEPEAKPVKTWRGRRILTSEDRAKMKPDLPSEEEWVEEIHKDIEKKKKKK